MLDKVLGLRPTNAVARLGERSRLPLLNPRDLVRALEKFPVSLLTVPVTTVAMFEPVLRAAREQDAVVGFSLPHPPTGRQRASELFDGLRRASEEVSHQRPVFVQAGPLRVMDADERTLSALEGDVFRCIDAGVSMVSIDASALGTTEWTAAAVRLAGPVLERELSLELAAPWSMEVEEVRAALHEVAAAGIRPQFLRVRSDRLLLDAVEGSEPVLNFDRIAALKEIASGFGAVLSVEDRGTPHRLLSSWTAAGVRKVELATTFARIALPFCLDMGLSLEGDVPLSEATAKACSSLDALEGSDRDRFEALVFAEALDVLGAFGGQRSAGRAMKYLAEHAGY